MSELRDEVTGALDRLRDDLSGFGDDTLQDLSILRAECEKVAGLEAQLAGSVDQSCRLIKELERARAATQPDPDAKKLAHEACPCRNYKGSDCCAGTPTVCICRVMFTESVYNIPQVKCSWRGHAAIDAIPMYGNSPVEVLRQMGAIPEAQPTSAEVEEAILHYGLASQDFQAHVITVFQLKEKLAKTLLVIDRLAALARTVAPADDAEPVVKPKGGTA